MLTSLNPPWSTKNIELKGTVGVILSETLCKDGNGRFTTVTLKALSVQVWIRYLCLKLYYLVFFLKIACASTAG